MEKTLFSTPELAQWLGVFHTTARRWIEQGKIKGIRVGRNYKVPADEAVRVLEEYQIPLPAILKRHKSKKQGIKRLKGNRSRLRSSFLRKLLVVEDIEAPALVCRRNTILSANQSFADLIMHGQVDLIGVDIGETMDGISKDRVHEITRFVMESPAKNPSHYSAELKLGNRPRRKVKIFASQLEGMKDVFLLIFRQF